MTFNLKPLDVLGKRKITFMPVHFAKTKIADTEFVNDEIANWMITDTDFLGGYMKKHAIAYPYNDLIKFLKRND